MSRFVRLARRARRIAAANADLADPVTLAKARTDAYESQLVGWAPGELVEAFGR
jgi:hypothetical protein